MLFFGTMFTKLQAALLGALAAIAASGEPPEALQVPDETGEAPDLNDVYIEHIATGGVGCQDPGSVAVVIADDRRTFLVIFDEMTLENPPGPRVKTTNCEAAIKLHVPGGWQVSLATVTTRGYAYLDWGLRARQTSSYFFAGVPLGARYHSEMKGPYDDYYDFTDTVPFESTVWSPCGGSAIFAVNTSLILNASLNPHGVGIFNTTSADGHFEKILHWQWRKC